LYLADRASMTTALSVAAVTAYGISPAELHNDSTSLRLYGAYRACGADGRAGSTGPDGGAPQDGPAPGGGAGPARPARGHSKDHRPDLKQLVWILTTCADGAVPFTFKMADGNTEDSTTHIATWQACQVAMWVVESSVFPSAILKVNGTAPSAQVVKIHTSCFRSGRWSLECPRAGRAGPAPPPGAGPSCGAPPSGPVLPARPSAPQAR